MADPEKLSANSPPHSPWPWVLLAFWLLWLLAMIYMSRNEWGRPRPAHSPEQTGSAGFPFDRLTALSFIAGQPANEGGQDGRAPRNFRGTIPSAGYD